ncbi:MAG: aldo/keto reductase [Pedosphaera sp.]|nr:aldo/keto reductase [Pedosphaera sp.]MSU43686.1 aldo/keto reductase [Pedosphaera sp.]
MQLRRLGNTDLHLTPIGIGTWAIGGGDWGMGWGPQEEQDSIDAILEGLESGINWIDTAHAYGFGLAEEMVSKALRQWGRPAIVATKCGVLPDEKQFPRRLISRRTILEEVEGSLRRLRVETIDLYQLHWPEPDANVEEAWQTLLDLQAQGKIRWPAVSNFSAAQLQRAAHLGPVASLQPRYSLLNRQIETDQMPWCAANNCGMLVYSPMESGLLTGKVTDEWIAALPPNDWRRHKPEHPVAALLHPPKKAPFLQLVARLQDIARPSGHSVGQLAVAWTLARPEVTSAIVGARRRGQISEIAQAGDWRLSAEELIAIETAMAEFKRATA